MTKVTLEEVAQLAANAREAIWQIAEDYDREPKIILHWTACKYETLCDEYHINITADGGIYISTEDFSEVLEHTWHRNSGSIGIALCCAYRANTNDLGDYPPTEDQIETIAKVIDAVACALWLTIDKYHVMTHGEAADNLDELNEDEDYGPSADCEKWDLQFLGTDESPEYTDDHSDPSTGGNVLRGKALWYHNTYAR